MKLSRYGRSCLVVLGLLAAATLSTRTALQAQEGPKQAVKPIAQPDTAEARKQGDQDDASARIKKLEETVRRLETKVGAMPPSALPLAGMAQTFGIMGFLCGAGALAYVSKIRKELRQMREQGE